MFTPDSRYRAVPQVPDRDGAGRLLLATDARPLPRVTGTFRHLVVAGDRLDRLAATYYGRATDWWHVCDANPEVFSPLALVAADPVATTLFPLLPGDTEPEWALVLRAVAALPGVAAVRLLDEPQLQAVQRTVDGQRVTLVVEVPARTLRVSHNRVEVDAEAIAAAVAGAGVATAGPVEVSTRGQEIVIPPRPRG